MDVLNKYGWSFALFICILCGCSTEYIPLGNKSDYQSASDGREFSVNCDEVEDTAIKVSIKSYYNNSDSINMPDILKISLIDPDSKKWLAFSHFEYNITWTFSGKPIKYHVFEHDYYSYSSGKNDTTFLKYPSNYVYFPGQQKVFKLVKGTIGKSDSLIYVSCSNGNCFFKTDKFSKPAYLNVRVVYSFIRGTRRDTVARIFPFIKIQTTD